MTRDDYVTNTPEDAAAFARANAPEYDDDRPSPADLIGDTGGPDPRFSGSLAHSLIAAQVTHAAVHGPHAQFTASTDGCAYGVVRLDGLSADHPLVDYLRALPAYDVLTRAGVVFIRPKETL